MKKLPQELNAEGLTTDCVRRKMMIKTMHRQEMETFMKPQSGVGSKIVCKPD
jgi:hypothetical protein